VPIAVLPQALGGEAFMHALMRRQHFSFKRWFLLCRNDARRLRYAKCRLTETPGTFATPHSSIASAQLRRISSRLLLDLRQFSFDFRQRPVDVNPSASAHLFSQHAPSSPLS
jgi:hypothetical protein